MEAQTNEVKEQIRNVEKQMRVENEKEAERYIIGEYWTTSAGMKTHIYEMTDTHIENILKGFNRGEYFSCDNPAKWRAILKEEQLRRRSIRMIAKDGGVYR